MLGEQAAAAGAPPGCDVDTYFTNGFNTSSASSSAAGTVLSAAEASTTQTMELVAQRRAQEAAICPIGYTREGGVCQPIRPAPAVRRRVQPSASPTSATRQSSEFSEPAKRVVSDGAAPRNAVWSEAFTDYEKRTGLGDATSSASRTQSTSGFVVGADHAVQVAGMGVVFGIMGGASQTRQDFNSAAIRSQNTQYTVDLHAADQVLFPDPASVYDYLLPADHNLQSIEQQTLTGPSVGATLSIFKDGFFTDGVYKVDFLNLNRQGTTSDTYPSILNANFEFPGNPPFAPGCISRNVNVGVPRVPVYSLSGIQTVSGAINQSTSATNFVLAQNFGYHFDLTNGYWVEPLVGFRYVFATYGSNAQSLGLENGHDVRLQAGARVGFTGLPTAQSVVWTASFTGLLYSDVLIRGFVTNADGLSAGYLAADQGQLRIQGIWGVKADLLNGFTAFLECQARGGQDYWGYGARIGGRFQW